MLVLLMHWNRYNIVDSQRAISFQQPINRSDPIIYWKFEMEKWKNEMSKNATTTTTTKCTNERKEEIIQQQKTVQKHEFEIVGKLILQSLN